ncbi:MAG TPA: Ig-like domain-containing protein, partial [Gemmatimonadales bacterium]|nr:Ig-like domain-containing protein [Gemmatimonadales bacterium]
GRTRQFAATALDSADMAIPGKLITWSSSVIAVATVDSTGLATAAGDGTTTITAAADGVSGTASLTVSRVVAVVAVAPAAARLTGAGATQQFTASAFDSSGASLTGRTFTWSASPPGVATVDSTGLATAVARGTTTISALAGEVSGTAELTVDGTITYATEEIAFISTRDGNREVYVMEADGSAARRITNTPEDEYRPAWAPDRSAIVFERVVGGAHQIFRISAGGSDERQLTVDGENIRPRFSPDGTKIAFTTSRSGLQEVWVMAGDGSNQRRLVSPGRVVNDPGAVYPVGDYFGDWSPDGANIAYVRYECPEGCWSGLAFADSAGARVDTLGIYGGAPSVLHAVRWSPQGWRIAMTSEPSGGDTTLASAHLGSPNGLLPDHSLSFDANAAYAGTWDRVVFESEDGGPHGIYSGNLGSSGVRLSPDGVAEYEPDHAPPASLSVLSSIGIAGDTITPLDPGQTRQLSGTAADQSGAPITAENHFQWLVNGVYPDYLVAQVDPTGLVTARAGGRARVIARYGNLFWDTTSVPVSHPSGTWAPVTEMTQGRYGHAGVLLNDGRVLISGGIVGYSGGVIVTSSTELYDPATDTSIASGGMRAFRYEHTATVLPDGRVLLVGGRYGDFVRTVQRTAELYDPTTGTTAYTDSLGEGSPVCCTGRRLHTATLLADGKVLVAGGGGATSGNLSYALNRAELYDATAGTFTPTGLMVVARQQHTATRLPDGRVLLTGGIGASFQWGFQSAEIFDPSSGTFALADSMAVGRREHAAIALADGRVLVTGGYDYGANRPIASAEIYDPATGQFTTTGSMVDARRGHRMTLLPDGRVLVTGGLTNSAEVYDPASGTFSLTGAMSLPRDNHVAVLLPSDLVAVFGATGGNLQRGIELYRP